MSRPSQSSDAAASGLRGFDDFDLTLGDIMRGERATMGKSLLDVQRELKIKAAYIAAIENTDPTAFETPGFIAGYVRSYARYLGMDPDWAYKTFCSEGKFEVAHGMSAAASGARPAALAAPDRNARIRDPFADPNASFVPKNFGGGMPALQPGAIGSVVVLIGLVALLGYGGWSVIQEVQRVRVAPVEQTPVALAELDPLAPSVADPGEPDPEEMARVEALDRLYRPQALEVPVMAARDAPISTLDPSSIGALVGNASERFAAQARTAPQAAGLEVVAVEQRGDPGPGFIGPPTPTGWSPASTDEFVGPVQVVEEAAPAVAILAVRDAWVRVRTADGTAILEKVMRGGERFTLPQTEEPGTLRTGNAGGIYFEIAGQTYGPVGASGSVVSDVPLAVDALRSGFATADLSQDADLARMVAEMRDDPAGTVPSAD